MTPQSPLGAAATPLPAAPGASLPPGATPTPPSAQRPVADALNAARSAPPAGPYAAPDDFVSQGVSSQGSVIQIEGGAGGKTATITGITKGATTKILAINTYIDGDNVTISGVTGMTQINGKSGIVANSTSADFDLLEIDSTGFDDWVSGGTVSEVGFLDICEAKTFTGFDGQASEIDKTTMCSKAKEFVQGLQDFGSFNFDMNYVPADPAQQALAEAKRSADTKWFRLVLPPELGGYITFQAFVKSMSLAGGVDTALTSSVSLRVTGEPTQVLA